MGQCGNQIGATFWPSVLEEYGFENVSGGVSKANRNNNNKRFLSTELHSSFNSFFSIPATQACSSLDSLSDLKQSKVKARVSNFS